MVLQEASMTVQMTHWERVRAALNGDTLDRPPMSVWRHFYSKETSARGLAEAMLGFQRRYDWDFMKVNPRASYHSEDWGLKPRFSASDTVAPGVQDWPIKRPEDWKAIQPLHIHRGVLGEQLEALRLIARGLNGQLPFLMTVFTPLSIAGQLAGSEDAMLRHLRESPDLVHQALEAITETFAAFARECLNAGASGLFYATTRWGTYDRLTDAQYAEFGRPYDLRLLEALPEAELHVLHVCGSRNMLGALADYPVAAFNWDTQDATNAWLSEGQELTDKAVIGGVSHRTLLLQGTPQAVAKEAQDTAERMQNTRWMLGSGCTFPPEVPEANLRALRNALRGG
jgi:uroporphyrinogen decarboxylase